MATDDVYGGPHKTDEICKKCGKKWERYRGGSYDWEYKDCSSCRAEKLIKALRHTDSLPAEWFGKDEIE